MPRKRPSLEEFNVPESFDRLRNEYRAGKDTRFQAALTGVDPLGSGADYHYRVETQYLHMMERARHYQRNDPIVGQAVRRLVSNVVQNGFTLDVKTPDEGVNAELKARWDDWATNPEACHSEGELTWRQMERLALSHTVVDGDVFFLPLRSGKLQPVEGHRVRTPRNTTRNVVHGVHLNNRAQRVEYWITKEDLDPYHQLHRVADIKKYPARDPRTGERLVRHLYQPYRFSQRRGVTAIAPVSDIVGIHDDTQFAALVKQQMGALIAILHERPEGFRAQGPQQLGPRTTETEGGYTKTIDGVNAGLEVFSAPGEKLSGFSPDIPGPGFLEHSMLLLTFIAINLDLPVHVLLLDPSRTNFSGWRGAIEQARLRFKEIQSWEQEKFHTPTYRWKVRQWCERDRGLRRMLKQHGQALFRHEWNPPSFPYLEPMTDASADLLQQRNGLNSPRRIQSARGREWSVISQEIVDDNADAIRKAIRAARQLSDEFPGEQISWRELISLPTPDGVQVSVSATGFGEVSEGQQQEPQQGGRLSA